jgi:hypothetical protein
MLRHRRRHRAAEKASERGEQPPEGLVEQAGLKRIHWPQRWEDYSFFKHDTYNNDEARTPPLNGMSLIYNKGQRITTRTQSGDPLNLHNFAWMWGVGADTSGTGGLGTAEFL